MSVTIQSLLNKVELFKTRIGKFSIGKTEWWEFIVNLINKVSEVENNKADADHTHDTSITVTPTLDVGGLKKDIEQAGRTPQQLWEALLAPYVAPVLGSISITPGNTVEVGTTVTILTAALTWQNDSEGNVPQNVEISNTGFPDVVLTSSQQTINAQANTTKQRITAGSEEWRLTAQDKNGNGLAYKYDRIYWYFRRFFGASDLEVTDNASAQALIEALQQSWLDSNRAGSVTCQAANADAANYTYIAHAASLGDLSGIIMNGATPVLGAFTKLGDYDYTNAARHKESYRIYKSNAKGAFSSEDSLVIS